jgi:predicted nucleotidyltransferase
MPERSTTFVALPVPHRGIAPALLDRELAVAMRSLARWPGVRRIWLFGSAACGGPWDWRSDLDCAVEGMAVTDQARAWAELDEVLSLPVDLIRWEAANPVLRGQILQKGRLIYGKS